MPDCQIEYGPLQSANGLPCGRSSVAECADCGKAICEKCRMECCADSWCDWCYDYHVTHTCLRKPVKAERRTQERTETA